jgi:hypothetical protein
MGPARQGGGGVRLAGLPGLLPAVASESQRAGFLEPSDTDQDRSGPATAPTLGTVKHIVRVGTIAATVGAR